MKNFILILSFLILCMTVNAQEQYTIDLTRGPNIGTEHIVIDSVIDNRMLTESFGITAKGLSNRKVPIILQDNILGIQKYIKSIAPDTLKRIHLTMVINHIWMYESTGVLAEEGVCDFDATFCIRDANNNLMAIQEFSDEIKEKKLDASGTHVSRLVSVLHKAVLFADRINFKEVKSIPFSISVKDPKKCIAYADSTIKGFFKTFNDFYNNNPTDLSHISIKPTLLGGNSFFKLVDNNSERIQQKYYAYSDGTDLYINTFVYTFTFSSIYAKVISKGRYMLIDANYEDPALAAATIIGFGLIGGVIVASATQKEVLVDMENGKVIPFSLKNIKELLSQYPDVLAKYNKINEHTFEINCAFINSLNKREREKILGK